jgi:RNA polymerase sigma-70 factor, ECF subfamily
VAGVDQLSRLARAAGAGDRDAMDLFVRSTYDQVWTYCSAFVSPDRADDLAQDTFVRAVRSIAGYRGESVAKTWLLGVARHVCLDELRSLRRHARNRDAVRRQEQPVGADASENVVVADLLGRLETSRREAFVLTQVLGLPYQQAAAVAGCPVGTIRSRVSRAREDLIDHLGRRGGASRPPASGSSMPP